MSDFVNPQATAWAFAQTTATLAQRLVLLYIAKHSNGAGMAWPSMGQIAEGTKLCRRSVRRSITQLLDSGLLTVRIRCGGRGIGNVYTLVGLPLCDQPAQPSIAAGNEDSDDTERGTHYGRRDEKGDSNDTERGTRYGEKGDSESPQYTRKKIQDSPNKQGGGEVTHPHARGHVDAREDLSPPAASPPPPLVVGNEQPAGAPQPFARAGEMVRIWNAAVRESPVLPVQRLARARAAMLEATIAAPLFGGELAKWKTFCRLIAQDPGMRGERSTSGWHGSIDDAVTDTRTFERIAAQMQPKEDPALKPWLKIYPSWENREPEWVYPDPLQVRQGAGRGGPLWDAAEKDPALMARLSSVYEACAYSAPAQPGSDPRRPGGQNSGYSDDVGPPPAGERRRPSEL